MTRSEAAKICQSIKFILENSDYTEAVEEALNMAIAALEQEETLQNLTKPNKSDLISRQAAIDAVHSYFKDKLDGWPTEETEEGYEVYCDVDKIDAFLSDNKYLSKRIENLPSAQPFTAEQIQTMQELEAAQVEKAYELGKADRPKGHWIENDNGTFSCSNCQSWIPKEQHHYARHCLYCGARMESEE